VLVPAGRSGNLDLVDPENHAITAIPGFSKGESFEGGHDFGATSVADTGTALAVTDRNTEEVVIVDPDKKAIVARTRLGGGPDYVRWVESKRELWVTEPDKEQIEVFSLGASAGKPTLARTASISVPGGPESLVIAGDRAYTNLWRGATVAIDVTSRAVGKAWRNGCEGSRGIEVDRVNGFVFVGCSDGKATVLDGSGKLVASVKPVSGMDIIAWSQTKRHLYLAGAGSAEVAIVGASDRGQLTVLGKRSGARGGHCVTTDDAGHAFVCDPAHGRLLAIDDTF
jgi:hypothetical protein